MRCKEVIVRPINLLTKIPILVKNYTDRPKSLCVHTCRLNIRILIGSKTFRMSNVPRLSQIADACDYYAQ